MALKVATSFTATRDSMSRKFSTQLHKRDSAYNTSSTMDSEEHPAISTAGKNPIATMLFLCNLTEYTVHSSQDILKGETTSIVVNRRKKAKTNTVKGSSFSNGGSEKQQEKQATRDGYKYHGTTFTLV